MRYESEVLYDLMKRDGLLNPSQDNLPYESELKEKYVDDVKGAYPKLIDYCSEWLNYAYENPIGEFPYETLTNVTEATINNVVPYAYKSAILKGQTLVNLVKNSDIKFQQSPSDSFGIISSSSNRSTINSVMNIKPNTKYLIKMLSTTKQAYVRFFNDTDNKSNGATGWVNSNSIFTTQSDTSKINISFRLSSNNEDYTNILEISNVLLIEYQEGMEEWDIPYFEGMQSVQMPVLTTSNEDGTETNILTVNEPIELRGIGDVQDTFDCLTGEVTERISEIVLDGSEEWSIPTNFTNGDYKAYSLSINGLTSNIVCDGLKIIPNSQKYAGVEGVFVNGNSLIVKKNISTRELLKEWLSNNPITVQYELATPVVKTVELTIVNQDGDTLSKLTPIEGTMHLRTDGAPLKPTFSGEIPVEAITQNIASFIE